MIIFSRFRDRNLEARGSQQQNSLLITCDHLYEVLIKRFQDPITTVLGQYKRQEEFKDYRIEWPLQLALVSL